MGYHIKMQELAETGRQLVRQTEEWTKQLQAVRACVQDFIQDPGCSGRAAESMKAYMKEVHLTLLDWMLTNIASYRSSLVLYINGYREIEADQNAEVSQDVLEEELEFLTQGKAAYEQTAEELGQVYRELRGYMDIGADICDELPDQFDSAVRYVEKVRCDVGEYEEQHSHDLESFHEMNGYIKSMMERHIGGDVRGITSYQAGSLSRQPEYESASAVYSGSRAYVEGALERVKSGLFNLNSCARGREEKAFAAGVPVGGVVAAKGAALGGRAGKGAGLNAGIFRHMDELGGQAGGKGKIGNAITSAMTEVKKTVDKIRQQEEETLIEEEGQSKLIPGTGTISAKGKALLREYESLGEDYKVYENGELVAILSRDVEGKGNITYGYGIYVKNNPERRQWLMDNYGLDYGENVPVSIELCERMYQDYLDESLEYFHKYLRDNNMQLNQNQMDALIIHRHLSGSLGDRTQKFLKDMFDKHDANDPNLKELYWDGLYEVLTEDLEEQKGEESYQKYGPGWENRILDELELFFKGDGERDH